ncbi:hypothetical protein QEN19_000373 [Hanseniaspora menglaensis]
MSLNLSIMGHRGNKQFCDLDLNDPAFIRENSMESFNYTLVVSDSSEFIETDLRLTKDKRIVIIHDNVLLRCYGIDHKTTVDQMNLSELVSYGVPSFEQFVKWYLNDLKKESKVVLDIKSVVPLELMTYLEKEILNFATDIKDLELIQKNFILGLWTAQQVEFISQSTQFLQKLSKINITLSPTTFTKSIYKNNSNFIGCSVHYLTLWQNSNFKILFDFLSKHKDVFNEDNPFLLTIWTLNEKDNILQTLECIKKNIMNNSSIDGFKVIKIALCTDNPELMNKMFIVDDIFNKKQFEIKKTSFEIYKNIVFFNIISYALYSKWFTYNICGYSLLGLVRKITGM